MEMPQRVEGQNGRSYRVRYQELPAFDVHGFTKIVASGGEQYCEVRGDGRWQVLRKMAGDDGSIYGVASLDKACPKDKYRYTVGVRAPAECTEGHDLFPIHIKASAWLVFTLEDFDSQYGDFWQDDPYALIKKLGWDFNTAVGLHIDAYAPSFVSEHDAMEFMMPVRPPCSK
jgi:hypothetical protein